MQSGNFNINGRGAIGYLWAIPVNQTAGYGEPSGAQGNGFFALSTVTSNFPVLVGFTNLATNWGLWARNSATGSSLAGAAGANGMTAIAGTGGIAGSFTGDVSISDQLVVNMGSVGTSRIETTETDTNKVAIKALAHGVTGTLYTDGFFRPGADFGGRNGAICHAMDPTGYGLIGVADGSSGRGVWAAATHTTGFNYGVQGITNSGTNGYGVFSTGRFAASGTKAFRIDHPRDPENMYLQHYCTEGDKPLNTYQGEVTTDAAGYATVALPDYYDDINRNAKVQLTVIDMSDSDEFALVKLVSPVKNASFRIRTSVPNTRVAWEVKAERYDLFVRAYGAPVEVQKPMGEKGFYQNPELYGKGPEHAMGRQVKGKPKAEVRTPIVQKNPKPVFGTGWVRIED